ncbi:MAG: FHA domain-containing protein [Gammaproteobacteria bacterium]
MPLWVIELNDAAITVCHDGEVVDRSPGIAIVDGREVVTGTAAQARQQLSPRQVNNRFWQQLSDTPLPGATRLARHHADLAYHHLAAILAGCGNPEEVVFAVPAHYGETELALLLGICGAMKLRVAGLVDSAVAAVAGAAPPGRYRVADLHLHHATLVDVEVGDEVVRHDVETVDLSGLSRIHEACVDLIADAFLEQSRFDPLHEAETEQALHTNLGAWLAEAAHSAELELAIDYHGSRFDARVSRRELERVTAMVLAPIAERAAPGAGMLLTARLATLPGAVDLLAPALALAETAAAAGIAEHRLALGAGNGGVAFTNRLPASAKPSLATAPLSAVTRLDTQVATHVLAGAHAVDAHGGALYLGDDGVIRHSASAAGAAVVRLDAGQLTVRSGGAPVRVNGMPLDGDRRLRPGDHVSVGAATFTAISVGSAGAV